MEQFRRKYIGDRAFYSHVLAIAVPMILQNLITNFVSMLDNIMVGQVGTLQMSAVSIVNQFILVFNLTMFGGLSGAGIFGAQFFGKGDHEGHKYTFRFRLLLALAVTLVGILVFEFFGDPLIKAFLSKNDSADMLEETLIYGRSYLRIMTLSLLPFAVSQSYGSVIRETGETRIPMIAAFSAIGVNLILNYGLIFGKLGMPQLGVAGAAIATVIAKVAEAAVVVIWAHTHPQKNRYLIGLFRGFRIPPPLAKLILVRGCPLLINEFLWSFGVSFVAQCFSVRGLEIVAARNIASTLINLFNVVFIQMGGATGIIVGMKLGAGDMAGARDCDNKLIFFSMLLTVIVAAVAIPLAELFPRIYNTEPEIRRLAADLILMQIPAMPVWSYTNVCYFTLRSGGRTGITFLFDFIYVWCIQLPLAFVLSRYTGMEIHLLYAIVTYSEIVKVIAGFLMIRSDLWMVNMVND